jgi:hypothetical protein
MRERGNPDDLEAGRRTLLYHGPSGDESAALERGNISRGYSGNKRWSLKRYICFDY